MRLHLDVPRATAAAEALAPTPWGPFRELSADDGGVIFVAQRVAIEVGPLLPVTADEDPAARILRTLSRRPEDRPSLRPVLQGEVRRTTAPGWPVRIVHAALVDGEGAEAPVVEQRLCALYRFFSYGAEALLRVADVALFESEIHRQALLALLLTGRPDWSNSGVVALSELWQ